MFMIHCAAAVIAITITPCFAKAIIPSKSTLPFARIRSIALPVRIGKYKVNATLTVAKITDNTKSGI